MQIQVFTIPAYDNGVFTVEMNNFLKNHKILKIESSIIHKDSDAAWSYSVHYTDAQPANYQDKKDKPDYKDSLSAEAFGRFMILRKVRKQLSADEGVLPFALYTDEQMAEIAQIETLTIEKITTIKGIGQKKAERFGEKIITLFNTMTTHEESRKSD